MPDLERTELAQASFNDAVEEIDWGDEEVELICGLENPDICESCQ